MSAGAGKSFNLEVNYFKDKRSAKAFYYSRLDLELALNEDRAIIGKPPILSGQRTVLKQGKYYIINGHEKDYTDEG